MESFNSIPPGLTVDVYYCRKCPGIYTKEFSCPTCGTENEKIGWVQGGN